MARLKAEQLKASLAKSLAPVYLISGDENLLVQEACDLIRQQARAQGFAGREVHSVERGFEWGLLLAAANSFSLFEDKKLIELRIGNGKPGTDGSKAIVDYLDDPGEDNLLLVVTPKLDRNTQNSKWVKAIEKVGAHVQLWPVDAAHLPRWVGQRLQQAGLRADPEAIALLATRVEGNLLAAAQEVEKLRLLFADLMQGGGVITAEAMAGAVADNARYNIYELVDNALASQANKACHMLRGLQGEGVDATIVLWALARELRALAKIKHGLERGQQIDWAMKNAGVWEKRRPLLNRAAQRLSPKQIQFYLRKANAIDQSIKGLRKADTWLELEDLVLCMSGVMALPPKIQQAAMQ